MAPPQVIIRADGKTGVHGSKHHTQSRSSAGEGFGDFGGFGLLGSLGSRNSGGSDGRHGDNATAPSIGMAGGNVCLEISSSEKPGGFNVMGYGPSAGYQDEVPPGHNLFISSHGGDGGDGGHGEGGQNGETGTRGWDADEWRSGGGGGRGGNGGNAGYGTDGGNGGAGGRIEIRVREDDMCFLVALDWDNRGGQGGSQGQHGMPGSGGRGGEGGHGHSWVEHHHHYGQHHAHHHDHHHGHGGHGDDSHDHHHAEHRFMPGGHPGPNGRNGAQAQGILRSGYRGPDGSIQFIVMCNDGTTSKYASRYDLRVEDGILQDENGDGVFEPGEHIILRDISIRNHGQMPSPGLTRIRLAIQPTKWLDPHVEQDMLLVPSSVPGLTTVQVPGQIKALIKPETEARNSPNPLRVDGVLVLEGIMQTMNRKLVGFGVRCAFSIRYPVRITEAVYSETVAHGEHFKIEWTVENVSNRPYGIHSDLGRTISTRITTNTDFAEFHRDEHLSVLDREIHNIDPGAKLTFRQTFNASRLAQSFNKGQVKLQLMLSPAMSKQEPLDAFSVRSSVLFPVTVSTMQMQVCHRYQHNQDSSYLLLVNARTPDTFAHQISTFIQKDLKLQLDIFNINLQGSLDDEAGNNVMENYAGKTIIACNNMFTFFGSVERSMHAFMSPPVVSRLLIKDTSFLFLDAHNPASLALTWAKLVANPTSKFDGSGSDGSLHGLPTKDFLKTLQENAGSIGAGGFRAHTIPVSRRFLRNDECIIKSSAKTLADSLSVQHPTRNFNCRGILTDALKDGALSITVHEKLPLSARIYVSTKPFDQKSETLDQVLQYLIVASLPLGTRSKQLWDLVCLRSSGANTAKSSSSSNGTEPFPKFDPENEKSAHATANSDEVASTENSILPSQIENFFRLTVEYDLIQELCYFCKPSPRFFDPLCKHDLSPHLPRLATFLSHIPKPGHDSVYFTKPENITWFTTLLAELQVTSTPRLLGKAHCRKLSLYKYLQQEMRNILTTHFGRQSTKSLLKASASHVASITSHHATVRKSPQKISGTPTAVIANMARIKEAIGFPATATHPFGDLGLMLFEDLRTSVVSQDEFDAVGVDMEGFDSRMKQEMERAEEIREDLGGNEDAIED